MKTLRIKLPAQPEGRAYVSAVRYEMEFAGDSGLLSRTKAGQHTAEGGRLFFYVTIEDWAQQAVTEEYRLASTRRDLSPSLCHGREAAGAAWARDEWCGQGPWPRGFRTGAS